MTKEQGAWAMPTAKSTMNSSLESPRPHWPLSHWGYPLSGFPFESAILLGVCVGVKKQPFQVGASRVTSVVTLNVCHSHTLPVCHSPAALLGPSLSTVFVIPDHFSRWQSFNSHL